MLASSSVPSPKEAIFSPEGKKQREVKNVTEILKDPLISDKPGKMVEGDTVKSCEENG